MSYCDCRMNPNHRVIGITVIRTMFDTWHETHCNIVRTEIKSGYRDAKTLKFNRFDCPKYKCEIDVTVCPMICDKVEIDRCPTLKGLGE